MILLDKRTHFLKSGLALLLIPFFFACDDPSALGLELEEDDQNVTLSDTTFVLPASSIYIDSLRTDRLNETAFGQFQDTIYGTTRAIPYMQYNLSQGQLPGDSLRYSSAHIVFRVHRARASSDLADQEINIYEAQDTLFSNLVYLANRSIDYDETAPIASHTFSYGLPPDSIMDAYIKIPLSDDFGRDLFSKLRNASLGDEYEDSLLQSLYHYPPLVLVPGANNTGILVLDLQADTTAIYVGMENANGVVRYFEYDFRDAHFTQVVRDRNPGKLTDLTEDYAESSVPSGLTYLDPLAGVYTKVSLAPFQQFLEQHDHLIINRARLTTGVSPHPNTRLEPVSRINYFFMKENGRINGADVFTGNPGPNALLADGSYYNNNGVLLSSQYNEEEFQYKATVTLFTQVLFDNFLTESEYMTDELVLLGPAALGMGQTSFSKSEIKLKVYYTTVNAD